MHLVRKMLPVTGSSSGGEMGIASPGKECTSNVVKRYVRTLPHVRVIFGGAAVREEIVVFGLPRGVGIFRPHTLGQEEGSLLLVQRGSAAGVVGDSAGATGLVGYIYLCLAGRSSTAAAVQTASD